MFPHDVITVDRQYGSPISHYEFTNARYRQERDYCSR